MYVENVIQVFLDESRALINQIECGIFSDQLIVPLTTQLTTVLFRLFMPFRP